MTKAEFEAAVRELVASAADQDQQHVLTNDEAADVLNDLTSEYRAFPDGCPAGTEYADDDQPDDEDTAEA